MEETRESLINRAASAVRLADQAEARGFPNIAERMRGRAKTILRKLDLAEEGEKEAGQ